MANNVNVTNRGFEYLAQYLAGNYGSGASHYTQPTFIGWGGANGYNSASVLLPASGASSTQGTGQWSDVGPYQEFSETRVAGSSTAVTTNSVGSGTVGYQLVGTITASTGESVGESFLAMTATKPSAYTISGNQTNTAATLLTVTTTGASNGYYQMNNEVIQVTGVASAVWTIVRGANASVQGTAKTGDIVTFGNIPGAGANNPSNGDMFAHAGFQALALNSGDSIQFTWTVNIAS